MYVVVVNSNECPNKTHFLSYTNHYCLVEDIALAKRWDLLSKARKSIRNISGINEWKDCSFEIYYLTEGGEDRLVDRLSSIKSEAPSDREYDITKEVQSFYSFLSTVTQKKDSLDELQSNLDLEQEDLLHAIEVKSVNVVDGYKLYKRLHDLRVERRKIKDDIKKIAQLNKVFESVDFPSLIAYLTMVDDQKYTPRKLTDLF